MSSALYWIGWSLGAFLLMSMGLRSFFVTDLDSDLDTLAEVVSCTIKDLIVGIQWNGELYKGRSERNVVVQKL